MENKNIIIILLIIIIMLVAVLGAMLLQANSKEPTAIEIKQTNLTVDDNIFSVNISDSKGKILSDAVVNLTIEDDKGKTIINEEVPLNSGNIALFDFDLEKGNYVVNVSYNGNEDYSGSNVSYNLKIDKVTPTYTLDELIAMEYPKESPVFGHYKVLERQDELALIETSSGERFVLAGDGYYTYGGHDSRNNIKLGSFVGKY